MLARLNLAVPFVMVVPENEDWNVYAYEDGGYLVSFLPPTRSGLPLHMDIPNKVEIDGKPAVLADALTIVFQKDTFDGVVGAQSDPQRPLNVPLLSALSIAS